MNKTDSYIEELHEINAVHRGDRHGFRTSDVFCVDKLGRKINFSKPEVVGQQTKQLMEVFAAEFDNAKDIPAIALSFARFFYAFIAIHPFRDANRRTAFTFLKSRAHEKSCDIQSLDVLRRVLLEGAISEEMQKLRSLFITMLKPKTNGA